MLQLYFVVHLKDVDGEFGTLGVSSFFRINVPTNVKRNQPIAF